MIVEMKKITLFCTKAEQENALNILQDANVLHVHHIKEPKGKMIDLAHDKLSNIQKSSRIINNLEELTKNDIKYDDIVKKIITISDEITKLEEEKKSILDEINKIKMFGDFNPLEIKKLNEKNIFIKLYKLNKKEVLEKPNNVKIIEINKKKSDLYIVAFSKINFSLPFSEIILTDSSLSELRNKHIKIEENITNLNKSLNKYSGSKKQINDLNNNAIDKLDYEIVKGGMNEINNISLLQGYIPVDKKEKIILLATKNGWGYKIENIKDEDNPPTLLRNPKWINPIKSAFDVIAVVPGYKELDVSAVFLIFLSIFFAFIIGDAGYGLLFLTASLWAKFKLKGKKVQTALSLLIIMSSSTVIFGALTGNYFGIPIENLPKSLQSLTNPFMTGWDENLNLWNKKAATNHIMFICFSIGLIHLSIARLWNFIKKINTPGCLVDIGWFLCSASLFVFVLQLVINPSWNWFLIINEYKLFLLGLGTFFVILGLFMTKVYIGLVTLFLDVISNFVDIISYIRLYAVGTASLEIALAFNKIALGANLDNKISIGAVLILFAGHTLNIVLAVMGVMVHGIRLNTLEFSGHAGIEWAGINYKPFCKISDK